MLHVGSAPQTLGRIIASPVSFAMKELRRGSFRAICIRNGKYPVRVPSYGFTGKVRCRPAYMLLQRLIRFLSAAGAGKGVLWYVYPLLNIPVLGTYHVGQFGNYPGH
jgi:hypothetical protein